MYQLVELAELFSTFILTFSAATTKDDDYNGE